MTVIIIAILIGLSLGLFGSGGSILTVPALVYVLGYTPKIAVHMSLAVVSLMSLMAVLPYWLRRQVPWRLTLQLAVPGAVGALVGSFLSQYLSEFWQMTVLAVLMGLAATNMWRRELVRIELKRASAFMAVGAGIGLLTGLVGVGGGFMLVPVLVAVTALEMSSVMGISLSLVLLQSVVGYVSHQLLQPIPLNYTTIAWLGGLGAVGSLAGLVLLPKLPQLLLRRGFSVFLAGLAALVMLRH
ncbi:MAG TPA: sulfite exporter TauE/SafE family protein [Rheinheimera sp.]|nr:sulfite exporter TauE/SafE family protein [Rheinheimera sp.]